MTLLPKNRIEQGFVLAGLTLLALFEFCYYYTYYPEFYEIFYNKEFGLVCYTAGKIIGTQFPFSLSYFFANFGFFANITISSLVTYFSFLTFGVYIGPRFNKERAIKFALVYFILLFILGNSLCNFLLMLVFGV